MGTDEFNTLIDTAVNSSEQREFDVNIELKVEGKTWRAYTAYVTHREVLFLCDKGTATYVVDSYGDRHTAELFDWETDHG